MASTSDALIEQLMKQVGSSPDLKSNGGGGGGGGGGMMGGVSSLLSSLNDITSTNFNMVVQGLAMKNEQGRMKRAEARQATFDKPALQEARAKSQKAAMDVDWLRGVRRNLIGG